MPRRPPPFRQRDIVRAMKAAKAAGFENFRVEIEGGKLVIVTSRPGQEPARETSEWRKRIEALS